MCKYNNKWCEYIVKWQGSTRSWRIYCKAHKSFANAQTLTEQEFMYFKQHHPQMISRDTAPAYFDKRFNTEKW